MTEDTSTEAGKPRRRGLGGHALHACAGLFAGFALLCAVLFGAAFALRERPLVAPAWLHERLEARVDASMEGFAVEFGEIALIVEEGWQPRLRLRDLSVQRVGSADRVTLSDIESTIALEPLLRGKLQPHAIYLTGAQLRLRRDRTGAFDLAVEGQERETTGAEGRDIGALADQVESLLDLPDLAALDKIEANALTLLYEDERANKLWTVDGGRIVLQRDGTRVQLRGDFALLGGGDWASTLSVAYESRIGQRAATLGLTVQDLPASELASQGAALAWLSVLDASISGALRVSVDARGDLGPLNATLQIGAGALRPNDETRPIPFRSARSYFTFDPDTQALRFDELSVESRFVTARADGEVRLTQMQDGMPAEMVGQMRLTQLVTNPGNVYPEPLDFDRVQADVRLALDPFRLTLGQLRLQEGDEMLALSGEVRASTAGWDVTVDGTMGTMDTASVLALWPVGLVSKTRAWVAENVLEGELHDAQFGLRALPNRRPDVYLGFEFRDATTRFMKDMPPIEALSGHASLYRNRFVVTADEGHVTAAQGGRVSVAGTSFIVRDTSAHPATAQVELVTDSTITAALAVLDEEPFRFLSKAGQQVTLADGRATVSGDIVFPMTNPMPAGAVTLDLAGTLTDVRSEVLVPGRLVASPELTVAATNEQLQIAGPGRIGAVPIQVAYRTGLGKAASGGGTLTGTVELSERFADEFGIALPPGTFAGKGTGRIEIALQKDRPPAFRLTSDLSGLGVRIAALDWSLPRAARGTLEVSGAMSTPARIDALTLDAPGLSASGRIELKANGQLDRATFGRIRVGQWLDGPVTLTGRGPGVPVAVAVTGGRVDLRKTKLGGGDGGGAPLRLALDRLQISDTMALDGFRGEFTTRGGMAGTFSGRLNGTAPITGRMVAGGRSSTIRIASQDAGKVLVASQLLKQGRGGTLDLVLVPTGRPGTYDGTLGVRGLWVEEAPAMASLLSSISVVGLLEQMAGNGIHFSNVEARFRLSPQQVVLAESSAVGASMGISMDGIYDLGTGAMDMQGVVSPLYVLNGIGSVLTRKGEGLIGFNFNLTGSAKAPQVSVNPLSLFTPGMFREIFRRPAPKLTQ